MWYFDISLHCLNLYSFKYRYRRTDWKDKNSIINDYYLFFHSMSTYFKTCCGFFWCRWSKREGCNNICYGLTWFLYMPFALLNGNVKRLASSTTNNSDLCKCLKFVKPKHHCNRHVQFRVFYCLCETHPIKHLLLRQLSYAACYK